MNKTIEELAKQFTDELFAGDDLTDFDTQTEKNDAYVMCMAFGNHLMSLPLASRMTEEEKERVRELHYHLNSVLAYCHPSADKIVEATMRDLESIFGRELFEEEGV